MGGSLWFYAAARSRGKLKSSKEISAAGAVAIAAVAAPLWFFCRALLCVGDRPPAAAGIRQAIGASLERLLIETTTTQLV
jgi:hypothetical protein